MAGQPKTRKRLEAELEALKAQQTGEIPSATIDDPTVQSASLLRARAKHGSSKPSWRGAVTPGPQTRAAIDDAIGSEIGRLAQALRPGLTARIARTRPTYAAGWVEDYPIDSYKIGELLDYLSHEHGGQVYRVTLLDANNHPYFETNLPIAGPPRRRGKILSREQWEGSDESASAAKPATAQPDSTELIFSIFDKMLENERHSSDRLVSSVKDLITTSQKASDDILRQLVVTRKAEAESASLTAQIGQFAKTRRAMKELDEAIVADSDRSAVLPKDDDGLDGAMKEATKDFISSFLMSKVAKGKPPIHKTPDPPIPPAKIES